MELQGMRTFRSTAVREYVEPVRKTRQSLPETPLAPSQDEVTLSPEARAALTSESGSQGVRAVQGTSGVETTSNDTGAERTTFSSHFWAIHNQLMAKQAIVEKYYAKQHAENMRFPDPEKHIRDKYINYRSPYFRSDLTEEERKLCVEQERACLYGWPLQTSHYDIALREDGGCSWREIQINAINEVRSQNAQAVDDLLQKNGITLPAGAFFKMNLNLYDYYIRVEGLEDEELTRAIEQALNVGENGKRLYQHIEFSNPAGFDLPTYSQYEGANIWKRSLYIATEALTGYDIRTLENHGGTFWTPDGRDLWDVLCGADTGGKYNLTAHTAIYRQLAAYGWDSTPDAWRGLTWQDGKLWQPDELRGERAESDWQKQILEEADADWTSLLAGREAILQKEAADRAAGITSCTHFGPRKPSEFTDAELLLRHRII